MLFRDKFGDQLQQVMLAKELTLMGARSALIGLLTGLTDGQVKDVYALSTGAPAKRGLSPVSTEALLLTKERHLHASLLVVYYDEAIAFGQPHAVAFVSAFKRYHRKFTSDAPVTINQLHTLLRQIEPNTLRRHQCEVCSSKILQLVTKPSCPVCFFVTRSERAIKAQAQAARPANAVAC